MAIQFARLEYLSRSPKTGATNGRSLVGMSAYVVRDQRSALGLSAYASRTSRDGVTQTFDFTNHKNDLAWRELFVPREAPEWAADAQTLWQKAEACERRKDSQLGKHLVLALPKECSLEENQELVSRFVREHFLKEKVPVEAVIHRPHDGEVNWHAHLIIATRRLHGHGFDAKKARDLDAQVRGGVRSYVSEGKAWGEAWKELQNTFFAERGMDVRVDPTALLPR